MEVVLSTGRFGDEGPGVPFQKEEIREWSHVDRLTGMLERARVETGRWQASIQGAAKSYGKVIDSRERNSADGSVVQRARRQVEIFQSQGAGRSVQVVRASQWSSSRVTDSTTTNSFPSSLLNKQEVEEKLSNSPILSIGENRLSRFEQEDISERLGALIGTLKYPISSTVPLRRIDSKYSSRAPILESNKRSNSNEDLRSLSLERTERRDRVDELRSRFESSERSENLKKTSEISQTMKTKNESEKNVATIGSDEENGSRGSAIQLLPSSKSNRTFVNLMKDSRMDVPENPNVVCDRKVDDSSIFLSSQKIPKRVGFCKTEVHFVADSGKVNIVETDEKPPPTNRFRRKRRLTGIANKILPIPDLATGESKFNEDKPVDSRDVPDENTKDHQRCHTTTVKLGSDTTKNYDAGVPGQSMKGHGEEKNLRGSQEAFSHGIVLRLENRIYDRLEAYSSNAPSQDSDSKKRISDIDSTTRIATDVQASALKSARLVMNLTRTPIVVDPEIPKISQNEKFLSLDDVLQNGRTDREHDGGSSSFRIEWKNDHENKDVALDTRENAFCLVDKKIETGEFVTSHDNTLQTEEIDENKQTLELANEVIERKEGSTERKKSTGRIEKSDASIRDYDVVCTDSENNQVVLKVVTTHEPTIARVESIDFSKRFQKRPAIKKKTSKLETPVKKKFPIEHTYVNIFKRSDRAPIYENYDPDSRKVEELKNPATEDEKTSTRKTSRIPDKRKSNSTTVRKELEDASVELAKVDEEISESSITESKIREKVGQEKSDQKLIRKSSKDSSMSKITSSKPRVSKISKSLPPSRTSSHGKSSISSAERDSRLSNVNAGQEKLLTPGKASSRPIVSTSSTKNKETRGKPMEVVYQTAVYNMKNEKLAKPQSKSKEVKGPRYLNELICGAKTKRPSNSKNKSSSTIQYSSHNKGAPPTVRHWK